MKKLFLSCLAAMIMLTSCSNDSFIGTFTKAATGYTADIVHSTGTDTHTMKLNSGDVLTVHHETKSGDMRITTHYNISRKRHGAILRRRQDCA